MNLQHYLVSFLSLIVLAGNISLHAANSDPTQLSVAKDKNVSEKAMQPSGQEGSGEKKALPKRMPPWGDKFPEADSVFRISRKSIENVQEAQSVIATLERTIEKYPDYPMKGFLLYYLGLNCRITGDFTKATKSFDEAMKEKPDLAYKTPIVSYLKSAKDRVLLQTLNIVFIVMLLLVLIPALFNLIRKSATELPWKKILIIYGIVLVLWTLFALIIPRIYGPMSFEKSLYPNPTLSTSALGQLGTAALWSLFGYGLFAILATLPVITATVSIRNSFTKTIYNIVGVIVVISSIMGLFYARHLYTDSRYDEKSGRLVFFIKSITDPNDIPEIMLPLFDEKYRDHLLSERTSKGKK